MDLPGISGEKLPVEKYKRMVEIQFQFTENNPDDVTGKQDYLRLEGMESRNFMDTACVLMMISHFYGVNDNYGNIRRLPTDEERDQAGRAGIYYHVDYVGAPRSYKWIRSRY